MLVDFKWANWQEKEMKKLLTDGCSDYAIADELQVPLSAVVKKRQELGDKKMPKNWTQDEIDYFLDNYETKTYKQMAVVLKKNIPKICRLAKFFGISKGVNWTDDEVEFIRENYKSMSFKDIATELHRPYRVILQKANQLGISRRRNWSQQEEDYLINNFQSLTDAELGKILDRDSIVIYNKRVQLGLYREN